MPQELTLNAAAFSAELQTIVDELRESPLPSSS